MNEHPATPSMHELRTHEGETVPFRAVDGQAELPVAAWDATTEAGVVQVEGDDAGAQSVYARVRF